MRRSVARLDVLHGNCHGSMLFKMRGNNDNSWGILSAAMHKHDKQAVTNKTNAIIRTQHTVAVTG